MAVFLINICKFNGCEKIFPSLNDLIHHIEDTHIDNDSLAPGFTERTQSACLPLSCVLRFITHNGRKEGASTPGAVAGGSTGADKSGKAAQATSTGLRMAGASSINQNQDQHTSAASNGNGSPGGTGSASGSPEQNGAGGSASGEPAKSHLNQAIGSTDLKRKIAIKHHSYSISSSNRSTTPTGSEMDDDEMMVSESEDSNDSWTTEEFSSEFIMRYGSRRHAMNGGMNISNEKPFACPVPGCKKRYKNVNGIKYHSKNGHKKDGNRVRKGFKCFCGKSYKTSQRLKNHNQMAHAATTSNGATADGGTLAAVPLASPALPSASLISSAPLTSPLSATSVISSCSPQSSGSCPSFPASVASSQIASNGVSTAASPSTITITQVTHKIPRTSHVITASTAASVTSVAATVPATSSTVFAVSSSSSSAPTVTNAASAMGTSASIKYDNLGILTPATSPKLIANLCQDANQPLLQPAGASGGGITLKSVTNAPGIVAGPASGEQAGGTGKVGIALVVSPAAVATETKVGGGPGGTNVAGAGGGGPKNAVLPANGQLYTEET